MLVVGIFLLCRQIYDIISYEWVRVGLDRSSTDGQWEIGINGSFSQQSSYRLINNYSGDEYFFITSYDAQEYVKEKYKYELLSQNEGIIVIWYIAISLVSYIFIINI